MPLNVISNYAANVAHRNLQNSDMAATNSLAKLSAGTRVLSAKDDAAALAVGSRLSLEESGLKQAAVNAGQASSMLQIADGAMSQVFDILSRMKSLAVQAGSGQLSDTDRSNLNTEYQQLTSEITRIAGNTTFSGTNLVNGSQSLNASPTGYASGQFVNGITVKGFTVDTTGSNSTFSISHAASSSTYSLSDGTTTYTGTIAPAALTGGKVNGPITLKLTAAGSDAEMDLSLGANFDTQVASSNSAAVIVGSNTTSFTFKVGSGTTSSDDITINIGGVTLAALGIDSTSSVDTVSNAASASNQINSAVGTLNTARATVGALQNRLDFAASNISIATENTEAARSNLMDLDVASEISNLTSKQILIQTGVAMLAQANQLPQGLLRLLQ